MTQYLIIFIEGNRSEVFNHPDKLRSYLRRRLIRRGTSPKLILACDHSRSARSRIERELEQRYQLSPRTLDGFLTIFGTPLRLIAALNNPQIIEILKDPEVILSVRIRPQTRVHYCYLIAPENEVAVENVCWEGAFRSAQG